MIGMLRKELLNLGTVRVDLALEHAQHSHPRQSQATLGASKRLAGDELGGTRKDFHPLLIGLRTRQLLSVEELLPLVCQPIPKPAVWGRLPRRPTRSVVPSLQRPPEPLGNI